MKSVADLRAYQHLQAHTRYEPDYAFAELRRRQVGDLGVVLAYLPKSPFMHLVALDAVRLAVEEANQSGGVNASASTREGNSTSTTISPASPPP